MNIPQTITVPPPPLLDTVDPQRDGQVEPDAGATSAPLVRRLVQSLFKRRWLIAATMVVALLLGLLMIIMSTPRYQAVSILEVAREAPNVVQLNEETSISTATTDQEFYETQWGLLRGPALAREVVRRLNLASNPAFTDFEVQPGMQPRAEHLIRERQAAEFLQKNTVISPQRLSRLVEVRFRHPDPGIAARVANTLAETYIQTNVSRRVDQNSYAREFLERRLGETRGALEASERQLAQYASQQRIINIPTSDQTGEGQRSGGQTASQTLEAANLAGLSQALTEARAARATAEARYRAEQARGAANRPEVLQNPAMNALIERRAEVSARIAELSATYRDEYPVLAAARQQLAIIEQQMNGLRTQLASQPQESVNSEYRAAVMREQALQAQVSRLENSLLRLGQASIQYNILSRDVDTNRQLYGALLEQFKAVGVASNIGNNNANFVLRAEPPTRPYSPNIPRILLLSALLGGLAGIALAMLLEALDLSASSPDDLQQRLGEPLLGVIPRTPDSGDLLKELADRRSQLAEAYLTLHANLRFATPNGAPRTLSITSTKAQEGKSTSAIALAFTFARQGERVLLIDSDLRRPSVHERIGMTNAAGFSNVLSGQTGIEAVARRCEAGQFDVVTAGPTPPNPAELLGGPHLAEAMERALRSYDRIIVDAPPVLGLADAPLVGHAVEGIIYVVQANLTRVGAAQRGIERLKHLQGNVIGVVLTKFKHSRSAYSDYEYYGHYNYAKRGQERSSAT